MALNIIVERNIPFIRGVFEPLGCMVEYLAPGEITNAAMREADALVTRTRVRCDSSLLEGSRCSLIASTTIGLDHVDRQWCESAGIKVCNAPGCNAPAVAQYVLASLMRIKGPNLNGLRLGIVGAGHVGSIVQRWAEGLGMEVLACDPPRALREGQGDFVSLDYIAEHADAITFHTPLTATGQFPTCHMADDDFFNRLSRHPVIVNSARGSVVDNQALLRALENKQVSHAVIDCWEGEPSIDRRLLDAAVIATPHIAGYSLEGKIRATAMAVEAVSRHFNLPSAILNVQMPPDAPALVDAESILSTYAPDVDTAALKSNPDKFEELRNGYALRHEPF